MKLTPTYSWLCTKDYEKYDVRQDSVFEGNVLSIKQLLLVVYCWSLKLEPDQIAQEVGVDREAVVKLCKLCRSICELWLKKNSTKVGGLDPETGCPLVIALEMHKISRPRRAGTNKLCWLLSGVDKSMGDLFIASVPNNKPETVKKTILDYVHTGTKVITDRSWPDINLSAMGYVHEVATEDDPETTDGFNDGQPYNSLWSQVRHSSGFNSGVTDTALDSYLHQWLFENKARAKGQGIFASFLMAIQVRRGFFWCVMVQSYLTYCSSFSGKLPSGLKGAC